MAGTDVQRSSTNRNSLDRVRHRFNRPTRRIAASLRRLVRRSGGPLADGSGRIFARATPETATITEEYRYTQTISVNPTLVADPDPNHKPVGNIEIIVPYDGKRFFGRTAREDVRARLESSEPGMDTGDLRATIGHLVLTDVRDAQLVGDDGNLTPAHGAIPLIVPVSRPSSDGDEMRTDHEEAALKISYRPPELGDYPHPLKVVASLFDPDDAPAVTDALPAPQPTKKTAKKSTRASWEPISQVAFSTELQLSFTIFLYLPRRSGILPIARIKRVALHWPTITSLTENFLRFEIGGESVAVQYDPNHSNLEWRDLAVRRATSSESIDEDVGGEGDADGPAERRPAEPSRRSPDDDVLEDLEGLDGPPPDETDRRRAADDSSTADDDDPPDGSTWHLRSDELRLFVRQPGQLRGEETLTGEIEVEVDGLLSGIDARLFDACGRRHRKGTLELKTLLTTSFTVYLDDEFERRLMKATHTLQFDEIVPTKNRIDDITSALRDRGFSVTSSPFGDTDSRHPTWVMYADRNEGPNTIGMLLFVHGRHHRTERRAQSPGLHRYTSKMESGDLRITIHGEVPRSSTELTYEVNKLRESLGERFAYVQDQR